MSVPTYSSPNPAPPARPATVTISSLLLYGIAAAQVLVAVLALATLGDVQEAYRNSFGNTEFDEELTGVVAGTMVVVAVIYIIIAAGLVVLSIFNGMGKNPSRIVTWVFAGLGLCCNGLSLFDSVPGAVTSSTTEGGPSEQQFEADLAATLPGWYQPATVLLTVLTVAGLIAVIILLALPQSNAFFRKKVAWNPAAPYPGYPGVTGSLDIRLTGSRIRGSLGRRRLGSTGLPVLMVRQVLTVHPARRLGSTGRLDRRPVPTGSRGHTRGSLDRPPARLLGSRRTRVRRVSRPASRSIRARRASRHIRVGMERLVSPATSARLNSTDSRDSRRRACRPTRASLALLLLALPLPVPLRGVLLALLPGALPHLMLRPRAPLRLVPPPRVHLPGVRRTLRPRVLPLGALPRPVPRPGVRRRPGRPHPTSRRRAGRRPAIRGLRRHPATTSRRRQTTGSTGRRPTQPDRNRTGPPTGRSGPATGRPRRR